MSRSITTLFSRLTMGVYVIGVGHGEVRNAFTDAWVMQVSFDPLLLALSINPNHSSYGLLKQSGAFSVNVLKHDRLELAAHYGGPAGADKLALREWTPGRSTLTRSGPGLVRVSGDGRMPGGQSCVGYGNGDRRQAVGLQSRAHDLSRHRHYGRCRCPVS